MSLNPSTNPQLIKNLKEENAKLKKQLENARLAKKMLRKKIERYKELVSFSAKTIIEADL